MVNVLLIHYTYYVQAKYNGSIVAIILIRVVAELCVFVMLHECQSFS